MLLKTNAILVHYGEIGLKGKNQPHFLRRLKRNLKQKFQNIGVTWRVHQPYGYCSIAVPSEEEEALDDVLEALSQVTGIVWYAPAHRLPARDVCYRSGSPNYKLIEERISALAKNHYAPGATFCVRVKRGDKRFPLTSPELEHQLGNVIIQNTPWRKVELKNPDQTFYVDIQAEGLYLHATKYRGLGGLPVGISGHVLTLLSGGIDSPVAAYLTTKRGCSMDFIHFTATPLQQYQAPDYKVSQIVQKLSKITLHSRLYLVPYTHFELAILGEQVAYELIIFRRFMIRVAQQLARRQGAQALVTGDNLGQVASQTLENIVSNSQAARLPILRPLLTYDKQEIIDLAQRIRTYPLSVEPYKDCCSILSKQPKTKSNHQTISQREQEHLPHYQNLIRRTLDDVVCLEYECGKLLEN